jgi:hypothetical protein
MLRRILEAKRKKKKTGEKYIIRNFAILYIRETLLGYLGQGG